MTQFPSLNYQQYPEIPPTVGVGNQQLDGVGSAKMPLSSSLGGISTGAPLNISASTDTTSYTQIQTFSYPDLLGLEVLQSQELLFSAGML